MHRLSPYLFLCTVLLPLAACSDPSLLVSDEADAPETVSDLSASKKAVPFRGMWVNMSSAPVPPEATPEGCAAYFTTAQTGRAAHMGHITGTGATCASNIRFLETPPFNDTGGGPPYFVADFSNEMTWTAPNGDQLYLRPNGGTFVQSMADMSSSIRGSLTIDGGTGRFAGASGHADVIGAGRDNVDRLRFDGWIRFAE